MTSVICIIQARMGSSRLPGKVMLDLADERVISHVIRRCKAIPSVSMVICACPNDSANDPLVAFAQDCGAETFRGSEDDVLARYYLAAKPHNPDYVMRVTSDCPLLDPDVCEDLVQNVISGGADYGGNGGYPHGLDCEVMTFKALEEAYNTATHAGDREHVTLWIKRQNHYKTAHITCAIPGSHDHRWVLDNPEDRTFMDTLFKYLPTTPAMPTWQEVVAVVDKHPELKSLNAAQASMWANANKAIMADAVKDDAK